jgi:hypothetical protein
MVRDDTGKECPTRLCRDDLSRASKTGPRPGRRPLRGMGVGEAGTFASFVIGYLW